MSTGVNIAVRIVESYADELRELRRGLRWLDQANSCVKRTVLTHIIQLVPDDFC